jgi:diguanylate cyclase (GGDEF)-like protein
MAWHRWLAPLLICAVAGASAQDLQPLMVTQLPTSLAGEWLFRTGNDPAWSSPFRERRNWQRIRVPGAWEQQGYRGYNGHAWYRLSLFISSQLAGSELGLDLGTIGDADEVFLNGRRVGATGAMPPRFDKATLARRFYLLPQEAVRFGEYNELAIHAYNEARFGGFLGPAPRIERWGDVLRRQVLRDLLIYCLVALLATLAIFHGALFLAQRSAVEHLAFSAFLLFIATYYLTYTHWGPLLLLGHNLTFRLNVVCLLAAVAQFSPPLLRIADRRLPLPLVVVQAVLALGALFCLAWRDESDLYFWVYLAEGMVSIIAVLVIRSLVELVRRRHPWGWPLLLSTALLLALVIADILVDIGVLPRGNVAVGELFSPLGMVPFALLFSLALAQNWVEHRWGEPRDLATGLISRERFAARLQAELQQAKQAAVPLAVALLHLQPAEPDVLRDQLNRGAAGVLRRALRQIDLVARHDRDTFAVLLADTEERAALATIERLRRAITDSPPVGQPRLHTTAGIAQYRPNRHSGMNELLGEAEAALYAALAEGGDCTATAP